MTLTHVGYLLTGEAVVDYMKHYFLTRLNKLMPEFYDAA
jgi:hypothetical protein